MTSMRRLRSIPVLILLAAALPAGAAPELPRRATLGIALGAAPEGTPGALAQQVFPDQTAAALGVRQGDVITAVGGKPATSPASVVAYAQSLDAGAPVALEILRDGKRATLEGRALGRPLETYSGARVDYGAVPFAGGHLRDILVLPAEPAKPPVVFLIQGFTCSTVEAGVPTHPYRRLGQALVDAGMGFYRVEKPGVGDSRGGVQCSEIDFATELDAFRSAYRHLVEARRIEPDRVFMLGHSMGGMQAPMLAAENPPRGVAVFGTVLRNWADYHQDVNTFQDFLMNGRDLAERFAHTERNRELFRRFYFERQSPARIVKEAPQFSAALREAFAWDGNERVFGRHYKFDQDLAHLPLARSWRDTRSQVLAIYGESDLVAVFGEDHRLIADYANALRPGTGRYVEIPRTDHGMNEVGDRQEFRRRAMAQGSPPTGPFSAAVADSLIAWIKASMAQPPVRVGYVAQRTDEGAL
jgi:pimeloyl-ACP methyl ester carboxylesterase